MCPESLHFSPLSATLFRGQRWQQGDNSRGHPRPRPRPATGGELHGHEGHRQRLFRCRLPGQALRLRRAGGHQEGPARQEI